MARPMEIRLHAVDAPERHQPYAEHARQALNALCGQQLAQIEIEGTDRYGRSVAQVKCRGQDAAAHLVTAGLAWVYPRYAQNRPELFRLQAQARRARRGLWQNPEPMPPWQFRHRQNSAAQP